MYSMQLERHEVDAFAQILLAAYVGAAADARTFTAEWGSPPTRMDKSHRFRSIAQAQIAQSDQFALHQEYMESGRVQVTDMSTRDSYLIRSKAAIDIEEALSGAEQLVLFEPPRQNRSGHPKLLAYTFERAACDCGPVQPSGWSIGNDWYPQENWTTLDSGPSRPIRRQTVAAT